MRHIVLETDKASSIENFYSYLKDVFEFPNYYGRNLDSLYDCLTSISENITVTVPPGFEDIMEGYGKRIVNVFADAADYNDYLHLRIENEDQQTAL